MSSRSLSCNGAQSTMGLPIVTLIGERHLVARLPRVLTNQRFLPKDCARGLITACVLNQRTIGLNSYQARYESKRPFSSALRHRSTGEEAPSAKNYIESGVIPGARNLVNVKKVLVIGSGGLSIGQAGEFDYSGVCVSQQCGFYLEDSLLKVRRQPSSQSSQRSQCQVDSYEP